MKNIDIAQCDQKRRSFLKLSSLLGLGAITSTLLPIEQAEAVLFGRKKYKVSTTKLAMGTFVAITAIHSSRDEAENAIGQAFEEINRLSVLLSRYEANSPVSELNMTGMLEGGRSQEVLEVIGRSLYYNRTTNGAFDITVKPLIDLYKSRLAEGNKPTEAEVQATLKLVGTEHIRFEGSNIRLTRKKMGITLDGIAKGYIVDRASQLLSDKGISNHLINAGGDIRTSGTAMGGKPWSIAIQDPTDKNGYQGILHMTSGAIATSGNYEVYYDKEKMFHHIMDNRSGSSPRLSSSVTVKAATVMDADALSTSVFVMQPKAGLHFINIQPDCECYIIEKNDKRLQSVGWSTVS